MRQGFGWAWKAASVALTIGLALSVGAAQAHADSHCDALAAEIKDWENHADSVQDEIIALVIMYHFTGDVSYLNDAIIGQEIILPIIEEKIAELKGFQEVAGCG